MLSKSAEYAVRALYCLASLPGSDPVPAAELAGRVGVPENYLSKLLHRLQGAGVVSSRRGPGGGYTLAREPSRIALSDAVEPFDPDLLHRQCLLGRPECRDDAPCAAHDRWMEAADGVRRFLEGTTVADLARPGAGESREDSLSMVTRRRTS